MKDLWVYILLLCGVIIWRQWRLDATMPGFAFVTMGISFPPYIKIIPTHISSLKINLSTTHT